MLFRSDEPDRDTCLLGSHKSDTCALWWSVSFAAALGGFTCQLRLTICPAPMTPSLFTWAAHRAAEELKSLAWLASRIRLIVKAALGIIFGHGVTRDVMIDKQVASRKPQIWRPKACPLSFGYARREVVGARGRFQPRVHKRGVLALGTSACTLSKLGKVRRGAARPQRARRALPNL